MDELLTAPVAVLGFRFEGYRATSDGRIQSCWGRGFASGRTTDRWRDLSPRTGHKGYRSVTLVSQGVKHYHYVHRLILLAFKGDCPKGMEARHLDGNPGNNRVDNLAWGTHQENSADRIVHGTNMAGESHPRAKLKEGEVHAIRRLLDCGAPGAVIARKFGVSPSTVHLIKKGKLWVTR